MTVMQLLIAKYQAKIIDKYKIRHKKSINTIKYIKKISGEVSKKRFQLAWKNGEVI